MRKLLMHIQTVRGKPHHVRKQVALMLAGIGTAAIALVWFAGSLAFGAFAIQPTSFADAGNLPTAERVGRENEGIAGAAAILPFREEPARIEIVPASAASSSKKVQPTTLPF